MSVQVERKREFSKRLQWLHEEVLPDCMFDEPVRIPISDVFDLHTVPPREVKPVVEEYLYQARAKGLKQLRIIHGKGVGVQRARVRGVLAKTDFVLEFGDAPAEAGGWGATLVTLR